MRLTAELLAFLDPTAEIEVKFGRDLPHWWQVGVVTFITWRTWDSLPAAVVKDWVTVREQWMRRHGIPPDAPDVTDRVRMLDSTAQNEFRELIAERWEGALDAGHGSCPLRIPTHAEVVADSLRFFDGTRYFLHDYVVMPNHVHLLVTFVGCVEMAEQCDSWKHFTAVKLNKTLGRSGRFWQAESFDHLVRSAEDFYRFRQYIADNPKRAKLKPGEFLHYSRPIGE
jgi:putative transposase